MNNRGNKTIEELATEFIAKGFRFQGNTAQIVLKHSEDFHDFQSIVDAIYQNILSAQSTVVTDTPEI